MIVRFHHFLILKPCYTGGHQWPSGQQVWHLIIGCDLCEDSIPTVGNAEGLSITSTVERDVKPLL